MLKPENCLWPLNLSLILIMLLAGLPAAADTAPVSALNTDRYYAIQAAMQLLGTWALGNIIYSSFLLPKASRSRRYFYQMNLFCNVVIMLIAATGMYFALTADPGLPLSESIRQHFLTEKMLTLSIGFATALIVTGIMLRSNARMARKPERNWGYGRSFIIQGLFLFFFSIGVLLAVFRFGTALTEAVKQATEN